MTPADREAFAALMLALGETYAEPVSPARMEMYFAALADLELAAVRIAATTLVRTFKFFPRPAELREAVSGDVGDRAELAWLAVVRLVRQFGYYASPEAVTWPDEATKRAAMELFGGWSALCAQLPAAGTPEFLGTAKQFKAAFGAQARDVERAALPPTRDEARAALAAVKAALDTRGLPTGIL